MSTYENMKTKMDDALKFLETIKVNGSLHEATRGMDSHGLVDFVVGNLERHAVELRYMAGDHNWHFSPRLRELMAMTSSEMFALASSVRLVKDNVEGVI